VALAMAVGAAADKPTQKQDIDDFVNNIVTVTW
jgi:hypothetical protein